MVSVSGLRVAESTNCPASSGVQTSHQQRRCWWARPLRARLRSSAVTNKRTAHMSGQVTSATRRVPLVSRLMCATTRKPVSVVESSAWAAGGAGASVIRSGVTNSMTVSRMVNLVELAVDFADGAESGVDLVELFLDRGESCSRDLVRGVW